MPPAPDGMIGEMEALMNLFDGIGLRTLCGGEPGRLGLGLRGV